MINAFLLILLIVMAVFTVMTPNLLKASFFLAFLSIVLTLLMFRLNSPLAAVFELSICAGLITVIFISTISMTMQNNLSGHEFKLRMKRYIFLPVVLFVVSLLFTFVKFQTGLTPQNPSSQVEVTTLLWTGRQLDILGQVIAILAGIYGIVILFKERTKHE